MATKLETLATALQAAFGDALKSATTDRGEITVVVPAEALVATMRDLRDRPELRFESLIDVCGLDYSAYGDGAWEGPRYAAVYHLLSLAHNWRVRVRAFAADDAFPVLPSMIDVWPAATGSSGKRSTCSVSCSTAIPTCGACSPTTVSSAIPSARIFRFPVTSRCATTRSRSA
jgi:hypothetical protein